MKALDPEQNEIYKFLACEQGETINVKSIMRQVKKEIEKRMNQLVKLELHDNNLVKAINCRVIPVPGYVMNVCNLGKSDMMIYRILRRWLFHGKQSSDERLYLQKDAGGRGLKSFQDVYQEIKLRLLCYIAMSEADG